MLIYIEDHRAEVLILLLKDLIQIYPYGLWTGFIWFRTHVLWDLVNLRINLSALQNTENF